jgi:hypothetical protein
LRKRRIVLANPVLLLPRRLIDTAVADAKKTRHGLPTDLAICQRWWISDNRPQRGDRSKVGRMLYALSFESCCEMLDLDVDEERKRVLAEIDDAIVRAMVQHAGDATYQRRACVLACAGVPTAVGRQYVLGLVDVDDYEDVADPAEAKALGHHLKREARATAVASRRAKRTKSS